MQRTTRILFILILPLLPMLWYSCAGTGRSVAGGNAIEAKTMSTQGPASHGFDPSGVQGAPAPAPADEKTAAQKEDCAGRKASLEHVKSQLEKLKPFVLDCDLSALPPSERQALEHLVCASFCMDAGFSRQVYEWNYCVQGELSRSLAPGNEVYQEYFDIMFGPWDRLDRDQPFLDADPKPLGANFYPMSLTNAEWEAHLKSHPEDREAFTSGFTMIRRKDGELTAIPYSEYFRDQLAPCAARLEKAARATENVSLKHYLDLLSKSLLSDDYFQSDLAWLDLDGPIEVVLGPYEVYEDTRFGYKTAFQAQVGVVDREESLKLERISAKMDAMEANLPVPEEYKNFARGESTPIKVIDQVFAAGDAKAGILTAAFNLPNDERVRAQKGSKKVLLKNVMHAKFEACDLPIAETVLSKKDLKQVSFDSFFLFILMHEVSHALGPDEVTAEATASAAESAGQSASEGETVHHALKDLYAPLEECKADTLSLYNCAFLIQEGVIEGSPDSIYATYLGDLFRTIRFGVDSAHGAAAAMELGFLLDHGAVAQEESGYFSIDGEHMPLAIRDLARELLLLQGRGDYKAAEAFIAKYKPLAPSVERKLAELKKIPVDIRPIYPIAQELIQREDGSDSTPGS